MPIISTRLQSVIGDVQTGGLNFAAGVQATWGAPFAHPTDAAASVIALKVRGSLLQNFYCEGTGGVGIPTVLFKHDIDNNGVALGAQGDSAADPFFAFSVQGTGSNFYIKPNYPDSKIDTHLNAAAKLHLRAGDGSAYHDVVVVRGDASGKVSASIGDGNTLTPALGVQAKIGIGISTDSPTVYYGIWIGNTANASQNTTTYTLLGDDAGSTFLNTPASGGVGHIGNANTYVAQWSTGLFTLVNSKLVLPSGTASGTTSGTINAPSGAFTLTATVTGNITITCSYCTTSSIVLAITTGAVALAVAPGSGSFVLTPPAGGLGSGTVIRFVVFN